MLNTATVAADTVALSLSASGALLEVGLAAVDTVSPIADAGGLALYYEVINPLENAASALGFLATVAGDWVEGSTSLQLDPVEVRVGQDTLVSGVGLFLGNLLPLEGVLDTLVNIPLVCYDVRSAAGSIPTLVDFRWDRENGWRFTIYPQGDQASSEDE